MDVKNDRVEAAVTEQAPSTRKAGRPNEQTMAQELPRRRVGSITLGMSLAAAGVFFLLYYFVPGFDWMLVLKIAPAVGLILMGCEVLFFALRPGRWRYDLVSVFVCLCLMTCCFGMTLLPLLWEEIDPARQRLQEQIRDEYIAQVYTEMRTEAPEVALRDVQGSLYLYTGSSVTTLEQLAQSAESSRSLTLYVDLFGPYDDAEDFAQDCRQLMDAILECGVWPNRVDFAAVPAAQGRDAQEAEYALVLRGAVQMDWSVEQMTQETSVFCLLDEENELSDPV